MIVSGIGFYSHCVFENVDQRDRKEIRRRGKKSEHTSDARFDERFKFAYGLEDSKVSAYTLDMTISLLHSQEYAS